MLGWIINRSETLLNMENMEHVIKKGRGRPKKEDVKKYSHMFRLNRADSKRLLQMYERSKQNEQPEEKSKEEYKLSKTTFISQSMSGFLADKVLNHQLKIIEINKSAIDFVMLLTQFFVQYRGIKNNYNQLFTLLAGQTGEDKARKMLKIIEQPTREFIGQWKELESVTRHLREKYLSK